MTMRLLVCLLILVNVFTQAYFIGNPNFYGDVTNRFLKADDYPVMPEMWSESDSSNPKQQIARLQKEKKAFSPIKRFRPCYYSPIQCLIKRR